MVPMLKEKELVGTISIYRTEVCPFTEKQIALVQNFGAQAVIAIENTRLLNELRQSLDQQTAMAEVLGVISSSPGDLQPVFDNMLRNAVRICDAKFGMLLRFDGEAFHMAAEVDLPPDYAEFEKRRGSFLPPAGTLLDRVMKTKRVSYTADMAADAAAASPARRGGARSAVTVPMLKDDKLIGAILIYRQEVQPFADKQITLVQNFAAQAVIAIENTRLLNELRQSLEQQTATADVLRVISSSPGELEPVFQAMMENAVRICDAKFGTLFRFDGKMFNFAADVGSTPEFVEFERRRGPFQPTPGSHLERVMRTKRVSHTADYAAEGVASPPVTLGGARSTVDVPMLKDNELIGVLSIYRQEVRPFTDKQIELLQNFATQAVIAIENTRLLSELRQRTAELSESLEQQTATSEILKVISSSPGELQSVFQTILTNATRICDAKFGAVYLYDGNLFHCSGEVGSSPDYAEFQRKRGAFRPQPGTHMDRIIRTKQVNVTADATAEAVVGPVATIGGARSVVSVPMLKDDELIGVVGVYRQEVRPFNDKQIELVKNFAAQAVIAIENARLLNELRQRTSDLTEALEQQTATSDVLRVISSSPGELEPVFQAMLENATRICEARFGTLFRFDGKNLHPVAHSNTPAALLHAHTQRGPFEPLPGTQLDRVIRTKRVSHTADDAAEPVHGLATKLAGARSLVAVPMLKDDSLIGVIVIYRQEVRPFTDKQIALVQNFAAQAVIAIENTRLLNEMSQSLEQQTATADVLLSLIHI